MSTAARALQANRTCGRTPRRARRRPLPFLGPLRFVALLYVFVVVLLAAAVAVPAIAASLRPLTVVTGSMAPALPRGAVALVEPAEPGSYYGTPSIITYRDPARRTLVTHRVTATSADDAGAVSYTTRGDANAVADSDPVPHAAVVGAVRLVVPFVGLPVAWLHAGDVAAFAALLAWSLLAVALGARRPSR